MADISGQGPYQGYQNYQNVSRPGVSGFLEQLGERAKRRAEPRLGIALAGVGMLMILAGILFWAGERLATDSDDSLGGDPDRSLGIILTLAVVAAGFALLLRFKQGPLATAGVVASALGVPVLLGFATFDPVVREFDSSTDFDSFDSEPLFELPFQLDVIALMSLAVWLVCYTRIPFARGRAFYLGASAFILWLYVLEKVEEGSAVYIVTLPLNVLFFPLYAFAEEGPQIPDSSSIGGWSMLFAVLYYVAALLLDRQGHRGVATAFVAAGFVISPLAIGHLAAELEGVGSGILLVLVGVPLAYYGAVQGRRVTAWGWSFGAGFGLVVIAADLFEESAAGFGISAIVLGAAVVVAAHLVAQRYSEPDEMEPGPSRFTPPQPRPPVGAWAGHPGDPGQYQYPGQAPYPVQPPYADTGYPVATQAPAQPAAPPVQDFQAPTADDQTQWMPPPPPPPPPDS